MYNFSVLWKNEVVADVSVTEDEKGFKTLNYIKRYTEDIGKQPFGGDRLDLPRVYEFLENRWFEQARADVPEQLEYLGLTSSPALSAAHRSMGNRKKNTWCHV